MFLLHLRECQEANFAAMRMSHELFQSSVSHQILHSSLFSCCCFCFWAHASWCAGPGDQIWRSYARTRCSGMVWPRCVSWCDGSVHRIGQSAIHTSENDMCRVFHLQRKYHKIEIRYNELSILRKRMITATRSSIITSNVLQFTILHNFLQLHSGNVEKNSFIIVFKQYFTYLCVCAGVLWDDCFLCMLFCNLHIKRHWREYVDNILNLIRWVMGFY